MEYRGRWQGAMSSFVLVRALLSDTLVGAGAPGVPVRDDRKYRVHMTSQDHNTVLLLANYESKTERFPSILFSLRVNATNHCSKCLYSQNA